ncbi:MAG: hypothetical protein ThorAB25_20920 [Candidatus Thorarchaeota archaeon AB_25]|nr:MAG: hypothetical protein ThorAB25_20920 [Candidatus Thorarchaeota archaeon AB_25]
MELKQQAIKATVAVSSRVVVGMKNPVILLKISYIIGAILDTLVAVQMLFPDVLALTAGLGAFVPGPDYLYASYMSGIMMIGWTVLLIWGYMKPVERKDVLLITAFPVVVGLMISDILSTAAGFLPQLTAIVFLVSQIFLLILFTLSYVLNRPKTETK